MLGFKLGHFIRRDEGIMKAVFWSETKLYIFPFNPRLSESQEEDENAIVNNRDVVDIDCVSVKRIYGLGVNPKQYTDYDEDFPELLLVVDSDDKICLLKGETYGKAWQLLYSYDNDKELENERY